MSSMARAIEYSESYLFSTLDQLVTRSEFASCSYQVCLYIMTGSEIPLALRLVATRWQHGLWLPQGKERVRDSLGAYVKIYTAPSHIGRVRWLTPVRARHPDIQ